MREYIKLKINYIKNTFKNNKKKYIAMSIVIASIVVLFGLGFLIMYKIRTTIPESHIYVCDDKEVKSEFDLWIKDEQKIDWVPTFIIIKDKVIAGHIRGTIGEEEFSSELGTCLLFPAGAPLPDYKITNLLGRSESLKDIVVDDSLYIIEISRVDCPDCIEQDKLNKAILSRYSSSKFYIYYAHSDKQDVIDYYD